MTALHKHNNCSKLTLTLNVHCGKWAKVDEIYFLSVLELELYLQLFKFEE